MIRDQPPVPIGHPGQQLPAAYPYPGYGEQPQFGYADQVEEPSLDPLKLLWLGVHYRWLIALCLIAGLVGGLFFTWQQTPLYRATTKIEVTTSGARVVQDLEVVSQSDNVRTFETAKQKILSRDLARRIVFSLNLSEDQAFLAPTASFSLRNVINRATGNYKSKEFIDLTPEEREALAIKTVYENLDANILRNTSIIEISAVHVDPNISAKIANQAARSFIDQGVDNKGETSDLTRQFIQEQVIETKKKLESSEKALVAYAKSAGITLDGEDASLVSTNIADINQSLGKVIDERLLAERYVAQKNSAGAASLPQVFESQSIQDAKNKITELKATYQEKLASLKPGYPEMRRLQAQINGLQSGLNNEIAAIGKGVEIQLEQTRAKEAALREELKKLEGEQSKFQEKNIDYTILKREVDSNRAQYDTLIGKLNEVGVGSDLKTSPANIVDEAQVPEAPYTPRLGLNLAAALALFSALAAALIYIQELMNNTFAVPDQVENELKLPVLGIIPKIDQNEMTEAMADPKSSLSEAYRTLRSSIQFTGTEASIKSLLVTSSEPSEGKSSTVYKLASDFGDLGKKVLIIDADLRKPRMHRMYNTDVGIGLSNLLSNVVKSGNFASIFRTTSHPNVTLMSSGTIPPNPSDLLISEKMGLTIHYCSKKYDMIIVDAPPIMGLSDAPILSRQVDAVLLIVSSKQVSRKSAKHALKRLKSAGANVVGATLSKFSISKVDYNYAYRYMNYNYYSYESTPGQLEHHAATQNSSEKTKSGGSGAIRGMWDRFTSGNG